jgi:hypothetical protein
MFDEHLYGTSSLTPEDISIMDQGCDQIELVTGDPILAKKFFIIKPLTIDSV